jgi:hypothetical protein
VLQSKLADEVRCHVNGICHTITSRLCGYSCADVNHVKRRLSGSSDAGGAEERKLEPDALAFGYDITDTDLLAVHGDMPRTKQLIAKCGLGAMTVLRDMVITDCNTALTKLFGDTWLGGSVSGPGVSPTSPCHPDPCTCPELA